MLCDEEAKAIPVVAQNQCTVGPPCLPTVARGDATAVRSNEKFPAPHDPESTTYWSYTMRGRRRDHRRNSHPRTTMMVRQPAMPCRMTPSFPIDEQFLWSWKHSAHPRAETTLPDPGAPSRLRAEDRTLVQRDSPAILSLPSLCFSRTVAGFLEIRGCGERNRGFLVSIYLCADEC
jgi:hypothetical protein